MMRRKGDLLKQTSLYHAKLSREAIAQQQASHMRPPGWNAKRK